MAKRVLTDEVLDDLHSDYRRGYSCRELVAVANRRHGLSVTGGGIRLGFHRDPDRWPMDPGSRRGFRHREKMRRRVEELAALYRSGLSLSEVVERYAERHGVRVHRNTVWAMFRRHGVELRPQRKPTKSMVREAFGRRFTRDHNGYWRATTGAREHLHQLIWEQAHGPVPAGHCLIFLDGDPGHAELDNLACVTRSEQVAETRRASAPYRPALCAWCDEPLVPHAQEPPSAFNKRIFCGCRCKGSWSRGAPRGASPERQEERARRMTA